MEFIDPRLEAFASQYSNPESELLQQINRSTQVEVLKPRMLSGHLQGQFLSMISKLHQPARILEIGTYTGYSALCLVEGLQWDGDLHTIEVNDELEQRIRNHFDAHKRRHSLHLHVGAASDIIDELEGTWDLVFIDADKENYAGYFEQLKDRMNPGGLILADNVLWSGKVLDKPSTYDAETAGLVRYLDRVQDHPEYDTLLLPLRDGISMARYSGKV